MNNQFKRVPTNRIYFTYSNLIKCISIIVFLCLFALVYVSLKEPINVFWMVGIIALIGLGISVALAPRYLEKKDNTYTLKTVLHAFHFKVEDYDVATCSKSELEHSVRTFGSGGFLGFIGYFWNKRLGRYLCFVTSFKRPMIKFTHKQTHKITIVNGSIESLSDNL